MKKITTVLGDIAPEKLGYTSIHEHTLDTMEAVFPPSLIEGIKGEKKKKITLDNVSSLKDSNDWIPLENTIRNDDLEAEVKELQIFNELGGQSLMDCSCKGIRLDIRDIKKISDRSGVNIIACTGLYTEDSYPKDVDPQDREAIRKFELKEIQEGIDDTDIKAGCIKVAFGIADLLTGGSMSENELSVLRASCRVASETGYPVTIHPPMRGNVLKIIDIAINECGVSPDKIDICHQDTHITPKYVYPDYRAFMKDQNKVVADFTTYMESILDRGVFINFDTWGAFHISNMFEGGVAWSIDDNHRLATLLPLLEKGYASQIMFGHDKASAIFNYHKGSYGFTRFPKYAIPAIKAMGFEKEAELITVTNPARFLSHD